MAVVSLNTNEWVNADGLMVLFGTDRVRASRGGEFSSLIEGKHCVEATIDLTTLPTVASGNVQIVADNVWLPNGAMIEQVDVIATKIAVSGGAATLTIGTVDQDRTTVGAAAGIVSALAKTAIDALGEYNKLVLGSTSAGTLVGTVLNNTVLLTAAAGTADFTAGKVRVRVWYSTPLSADL
jgi:hypothetical protein